MTAAFSEKRHFLKKQKSALDRRTEKTYNIVVVQRQQIRHPGVAQLVARMVRDHEAVGSNPATRTIGESLWDSPIFYSSYINFLILLHGNVQHLTFGRLYVEP